MKKLVLLIMVLTLFSCSPNVYKYDYYFKGGGQYILAVPSFPQEYYYGGPSAVASVLNYRGKKILPSEVAKGVFSPKVKGTITADLIKYARKVGFKAYSYKGSIEDLQSQICQARPLIIFLDIGSKYFPEELYVVLVAYNNEGVVALSGKDKDVFIPYEKLLKSWEKTAYETLLILPPID